MGRFPRLPYKSAERMLGTAWLMIWGFETLVTVGHAYINGLGYYPVLL